MKNVCLLYLLLIGLSACGGKKTDSISLSGEIKGLGNDTIYLYGADRMHDRMDTLIAEKDKFSATLSADTLVTTILLFSDGTEYPLFLNKGNDIVFLVIGMNFILHQRWGDLYLRQKCCQFLYIPVGEPN